MRCLLFSLILSIVIVAPVSATAQQAARFLSVMEEMPLMLGLVEVTDAAVSFDGPSGRIIEAFVAGSVQVDAVRAFYAATLPQLGWARQANGEYRRDAEILRLDVNPAPVGATGAGAHFVLRPAKGQ